MRNWELGISDFSAASRRITHPVRVAHKPPGFPTIFSRERTRTEVELTVV